jgi:hypothetical protein
MPGPGDDLVEVELALEPPVGMHVKVVPCRPSIEPFILVPADNPSTGAFWPRVSISLTKFGSPCEGGSVDNLRGELPQSHFCCPSGVDEREDTARRLSPDVIGVPTGRTRQGTTDLAFSFHPNTRRVFGAMGKASAELIHIAFNPHTVETGR